MTDFGKNRFSKNDESTVLDGDLVFSARPPAQTARVPQHVDDSKDFPVDVRRQQEVARARQRLVESGHVYVSTGPQGPPGRRKQNPRHKRKVTMGPLSARSLPVQKPPAPSIQAMDAGEDEVREDEHKRNADEGLDVGDVAAARADPVSLATRRRQVLEENLKLWVDSLNEETVNSVEAIAAAERLVRDAVEAEEAENATSTAPPGILLTGNATMMPSPLRTAVCCLLLERICRLYSRYHAVLDKCATPIMRAVYVPDTAETRAILDTLDVELPLDHPSLAPYARKTYFQAYAELLGKVRSLAKKSKMTEMRLNRHGRVFQSAVKHWMDAVVRNYFGFWRGYTRRRIGLRDKYRSVFAKTRDDETTLRAIRRWRTVVTSMKKAAVKAHAIEAEIERAHVLTTDLQEQLTKLVQHNNGLETQLSMLEASRSEVQDEISAQETQLAAAEKEVNELRVRGTALLETRLQIQPPPQAPTHIDAMISWATTLVNDSGGMIDGSSDPFDALREAEDVVPVSFSAFVSAMLPLIPVDSRGVQVTREVVVEVQLAPNAEDQAGRVINAYEALTLRPSPVTIAQLVSQRRGFSLVFIAAIMRFFADWTACRCEHIRRSEIKQLPKDPSSWPTRVKYQQQWVHAAMAAFNVSVHIALEKPRVLSTAEQDDLENFFSVTSTSFTDLLPTTEPEICFSYVLKQFRRTYSEVRSIFLHYAIGKEHLCSEDFGRMVKDCGIVGAQKLTKRAVNGVLCKTFGVSQQELQTKEMSKGKFFEALVRLAVACFGEPGDGQLHEHFGRLVGEVVLPNATRSNQDSFRSMLHHNDVQAVVEEYKIPLRRAFHQYVTSTSGEMDITGFVSMVKQLGWFTPTFSMDQVQETFKRVQADGNHNTLDIGEWIDAVIVVAIYHDPDPFTPLAPRAQKFILEKVLTPLELAPGQLEAASRGT